MATILALLEPLDPVAGVRVPLRVADSVDVEAQGWNAVRWWPGLLGTPRLTVTLFESEFDGKASAGAESARLALDVLRDADPNSGRYVWPGAPVTLYRHENGAAAEVFRGRVSDFSADASGTLSLNLAVDEEPFAAPVLNASYAGTGGAEGSAELKGRPKPWLFGRAVNVEPVLINAVDSVYQVSAYGPVAAVTACYERGASMGAPAGDFATFAALIAATIQPGQWATCLAQGMVRLGAPSAGVITLDADGDNTAGFVRKTGEILSRIASARGVMGIAAGTLPSLDTAVPHTIAIYLAEQVTLIELAQRLAAPCNAAAGVNLLGKMFVARIASGAAAMRLDAQAREWPPVAFFGEEPVHAPYKRVVLGGSRTWRVHSFDEIAFAAPFLERGLYDLATVYYEGNIVTRGDGSRWLYIATTAQAGVVPGTNGAVWSALSPGKVTTFYGVAAPTSEGVGDLWFKSDTAKWYRASSVGANEIVAGEWVLTEDAGIGQAITAAAGAQATADGKVTTFYQDADPAVEARPGDLWVRLSDNPKVTNRRNAADSAWDVVANLVTEGSHIGVDNGATSNRDSIYDPFNYATTAEFATAWSGAGQGSFGSELSLVTSNDTPGGTHIQIGNNAGNDASQGCFHRATPFDPEDLYEVGFDVEFGPSANGGVAYFGVRAEDSAGATLLGDSGGFCYVAASGFVQNNAGRQTFRGYFRGRAATGLGNNVGAPAADRASPSKLPNGTVAVRPLFIVNYNGASGVAKLHQAWLRKITDATVVPTGAWSSTRSYFRDEGVTYLGRSFVSKADGNLNNAPPSTATDNSNWFLVADKGADGASASFIGLTADKLTAKYDKAGTYVGGDITLTATPQNMTGTPVFALYNASGVLIAQEASAWFAATYPTQYSSTGPNNLTMKAYEVNFYQNFRWQVSMAGYAVMSSVAVTKVQDGVDGAPGAPGPSGAAGAQGPAGVDGQTLYTWIAYANSADGTVGFTTGANTGQTYIGIANNKTTPTESLVPGDYTWSLIKGTDGVPGSPGADGTTTYTWIAYATAADGSANFTTGAPTPGLHTYLGIAANKTTATESTVPADYFWSLIKGADGISPVSVSPSPSTRIIKTDAAGVPKTGEVPISFTINATQGGSSVALTSVAITTQSGGTWSVSGSTISLTAMAGGATAGECIFTVVAGGQTLTGNRVTFSTAQDAVATNQKAQNLVPLLSDVQSASYVAVAGVLAINASASGTLSVNLTGNLKPTGGSNTGVSFDFRSKLIYSTDGGTTWVDVTGSAVLSTIAEDAAANEPGVGEAWTSASVNGTGPYSLTGLGTNTAVQVRGMTMRGINYQGINAITGSLSIYAAG